MAATLPAPAPLDVSALPPLDELLAQLAAPLASWMPAQRWYAHKGAGEPRAVIRGWAPLRIAPDHLAILTVVAVSLGEGAASGGTAGDAADDAAREALYQVPLVLRRPAGPEDAPGAPGGEDRAALVAVLPTPQGPLEVLDAARDDDGRAAIIATLVSGEGAVGPALALASHRPVPDAPLPLGRAMRSRVLIGEQSNTSMIVETEGASPLIVKLFRVLQDGENPDVVLQGALTAAGSTRVPALIGFATIGISTTGNSTTGTSTTGTGGLRTHSLLAQEFLPGVEDAWRLGLRLAHAGEDVGEAMSSLGAAVAEVHRDLAGAFGNVPADPATAAQMVEQMRLRLAEVSSEVPQVAEHRAALESLLDAAHEAPWPPMQRIHGDLHLGQVLLAPGRGWVLLDFEGEPLRPLAQRNSLDSPLRDVAGMLRSLSYVAGAVGLEQGADATAWADDARAAFLAGYGNDAAGATSAAGLAARSVVLAAFEADKAVYEALYEARNRPGWLPIPLAALGRISAPGAAGASAG